MICTLFVLDTGFGSGFSSGFGSGFSSGFWTASSVNIVGSSLCEFKSIAL